jgi:hypothetical protein
MNYIRVLNNNSAFVHVAVSETLIDNTIENSSIDIPGFEIIRKDRNREGGGVALYVITDLAYKRCTELESPLFKALWVCVFIPEGCVILCIVCPSHMLAGEADVFINYLETTADKVNVYNPLGTILLGDFNAKSSLWYPLQNNNPLGIRLHDYVSRCGMVQLIKEPTRIVENSSTLIDLIITDMPDIIG